jgi:hypothetical protein
MRALAVIVKKLPTRRVARPFGNLSGRILKSASVSISSLARLPAALAFLFGINNMPGVV